MTARAPFLSITVPTYNRAPRLRQCLAMLEAQIAELDDPCLEIEVLVVDNASTDETPAVVEAERARFARFSYVRNDRNLGIDGNIHRCSQLASGTWVQFLSDDDILLPGALRQVVSKLRERPGADFFFLNVVTFVDELPEPAAWRPCVPATSDLVCADQNQLVAICGVWLTFLSSFVFRGEAWNRSNQLDRYIGTDIYLSYALFDLLSMAHESVVVAQPLVAARGHYSGSYRIFYAFGYQWPELLLTHAPAIGFDVNAMHATLRQTIRSDLLPRVLRYRLDKGELSPDERRHVFHGVRGLSVAACQLWLVGAIPLAMLRGLRTLKRVVRRFLEPLTRCRVSRPRAAANK
jgi:abequosyltransferase